MSHPRNQRYGKGMTDDAGLAMDVWAKAPQSGVKLPHSRQYENSHVGKQRRIPLYYRLLFSLAIMGLFVEWLLPLHRSTSLPDTANLLEVLMFSAVILLIWGMFQIPGWLLLGIQFVLISLAWFYVCTGNNGIGWISVYAVQVPNDVILLLSGHVSQLSENSRVLILIVGWGLLVSSVQQLALFRGSTMLFTAVTIIYLLVLDFGFAINTTMDIVMAVGLILWMQAMSGLLRLQERTGTIGIPYARWGLTAFATAILVMTMSWTLGQLYGARPTSQISLESVFDKLQDWTLGRNLEDMEAVTAGTTGYGSGDGELGAPLTRSTEPVFTAITSEQSYWRGESIAYYDGRRWIRGGDPFSPLNLSSLSHSRSTLTIAERKRTLQQRIQFAVPSSGGLPLFNAGTILDVESVELTNGSQLGYVLSNSDRESFRLPNSTGSARVVEYSVKSLLPETDPVILRGLGNDDPEEVKNKYLQLPALLPGRVSTLAEKLASSGENRYDSVTAIRDYLQSGYSYTLDTMIPPPEADFVDHFLFDEKKGYCVHFATAMTILLRSANIPARYVQGYGPGTLMADTMPQQYAITQGDAHAWVEVYFAGAGWVPFDPTPGPALAASFASPPAEAASPAAPAARRAGLPALPPAGGTSPAPALLGAVLVPAAAWRWRRSLALLLAARSASRLSRERQLRVASLAWGGLVARYGPPPPGFTGREYVASLPIDDAGLGAAVQQFVRQWETLAYSRASMPRRTATSTTSANAAYTLSPSEALAVSEAAFIRKCLTITFRLT